MTSKSFTIFSLPPRWGNILTFSLLHLGALGAPWFFSWSGLFLCLAGWVITGMGITLGWHRLLTHGSYKTYPTVKYLLVFLGYLTWANSLIEWVGTHRIHHGATEKADDPHTPRRGWVWAHIGWLLVIPSYDFQKWAKDIVRDPWINVIDKYHWVLAWGMLPILFFIGEWTFGVGFSWVIWGGCVRGVLVLHSTWLVNSTTHILGYRNFETEDDSKNLWWVALLTLGEGWHNNHHAQPRSAAHGMQWWEVDVTYAVIRLLEKIGWAWDIVVPQREQAQPINGRENARVPEKVSYE